MGVPIPPDSFPPIPSPEGEKVPEMYNYNRNAYRKSVVAIGNGTLGSRVSRQQPILRDRHYRRMDMPFFSGARLYEDFENISAYLSRLMQKAKMCASGTCGHFVAVTLVIGDHRDVSRTRRVSVVTSTSPHYGNSQDDSPLVSVATTDMQGLGHKIAIYHRLRATINTDFPLPCGCHW